MLNKLINLLFLFYCCCCSSSFFFFLNLTRIGSLFPYYNRKKKFGTHLANETFCEKLFNLRTFAQHSAIQQCTALHDVKYDTREPIHRQLLKAALASINIAPKVTISYANNFCEITVVANTQTKCWQQCCVSAY